MRTQRIYGRSIVSNAIAPASKDHFKLFKKKPGGTLVGNLIRLGVNKATGGILGTGANRLPASPATTQAGETYKTPIQETVKQAQADAVVKGVSELSNATKQMLLNNQTSASNLPKTKALRDAERTAERMQDQTGSVSIGGGMKLNPMLIGGVLIAVIILIVAIRK